VAESDLKTDIALIKKDIKQIENFFSKVEGSMEKLIDVSKMTAVQEEVLKIATEKLDDLEERIETHRKEDEARVVEMSKKLEEYRESSRRDHKQLAEHNAKQRLKHDEAILEKVEALSIELSSKLDDHGSRLRSLEHWKYYLMGLGGAVAFLGLEHFVSIIG